MPSAEISVRSPRAGRWLLAVGSLVVGLVAVELLYRVLRPAPYDAPTLIKSDGTVLPLSEMAALYRKSGETPDGVGGGGPRSRMRAGFHLRHCYDRPVWPYFDGDGCVSVDTNSLGFRDLEFAAAKQPGELRILTVGDSFTFGSGVQLADSWPQLLEGLLRKSREGPVQVINGGFAAGSHWPPGYVEWLESDGVELQPDILILGLCLNDLHHRIPMLGYPVVEADLEPWLGGVSELVGYFQREWRQRELRAQPFDFADLLRHAPQEWEQNQVALRQMRDLCASRGIRFVVAVLPMVSRLGDDCPYVGLHELVVGFCGAEKIECIDLLPSVRHRDELDLWAHPTDQHPNHVANGLFAGAIAAFLAE